MKKPYILPELNVERFAFEDITVVPSSVGIGDAVDGSHIQDADNPDSDWVNPAPTP